MGTWGPGLFADDVACDIRDHYRELLEDGVEDHAATLRTIDAFGAYLDEPDGVALLALAVTQSRLGRLEPDIRDQALARLDLGADLDTWARDEPRSLPKRRIALERVRAQLTGPQPTRRRVRPPRRQSCGLIAGDVLALRLPRHTPLLRVVRVRSHRLGETPVLEELDFDGLEVPTAEGLARLGPRTADPITVMHVLSSETRLFAFVMAHVDWQRAGFEKVGSIAPRPGDDEATLPSSGIAWGELAERYRRRLGT
jgi:hypothetical protein